MSSFQIVDFCMGPYTYAFHVVDFLLGPYINASTTVLQPCFVKNVRIRFNGTRSLELNTAKQETQQDTAVFKHSDLGHVKQLVAAWTLGIPTIRL